jgi:DNA topoisomerase-6 subunit A
MARAKAPSKDTVERKLVGVADTVIAAADRSRDPTLTIPVRSLANVTFNAKRGIIELGARKQARSFFNVGMAKKFMQTVLVADALAELQRANLTTSLREIYYRTKHTMKGSHENTFDGQNESDPLIEDLEVALAALREELHVRAENAGSVVGPLTLVDDGDQVNCARLGKGGYSVPSIVEPEYIEIRRCTADFVLLVEKGTQWNRLSEDKFWRRYNCVLLTGNGQPPRGVRRLARRLHEEYRIPIYVLVDNDPWGYYIYSVVKQGSINLAFESARMAIPRAKFIGLSSADPDRYGLPRTVGIKLNDKDVGRARELLKYRWFDKKPWQDEIKRMLASGLKYELDALANKDFRFLTKTYLPRKLREEDWLDLSRAGPAGADRRKTAAADADHAMLASVGIFHAEVTDGRVAPDHTSKRCRQEALRGSRLGGPLQGHPDVRAGASRRSQEDGKGRARSAGAGRQEEGTVAAIDLQKRPRACFADNVGDGASEIRACRRPPSTCSPCSRGMAGNHPGGDANGNLKPTGA